MKSDDYFMQKALLLALQSSGRTSPNPRVGCVIVKDGHIIGEGFHRHYGAPHAEVDAIANATEEVRGATLYVNLEPCIHDGKTPPCAPYLVEKGIARVVAGIEDPNPLVAGKGIACLHDAGIQTLVGVQERECRWVNRFFLKHITKKIPYVIAKTAQSLDGCIAAHDGQSQWISGSESRRRVHLLRSEVDAVMVGLGTAAMDNPQLTVRDAEGRNPYRVIADSNLKLSFESHLFADRWRRKTIVLCSMEATQRKKAANLLEAGVHVVGVEQHNGKLDLSLALSTLYEQFAIGSLLVEGGSRLLSSFADENLIDEIHFFVAPIIIGSGIHPFSDYNIPTLNQAAKYNARAIAKSGDDTHIIVTRKTESEEEDNVE